MKRTLIKNLLESAAAVEHVLVKGWVRTRRDSKGFSFLELNDGSCLKNLQVIVDESLPAFAQLKDVATGAAIEVEGALVESPGSGQKWEVRASSVRLLGTADPETYPLQKKRHTDEFLRTIAHLRPRTNKFGALFRIRSECAFAVHRFFQERGFLLPAHADHHRPRLRRARARCSRSPRCDLPAGAARGRGAVDCAQDFFGKDGLADRRPASWKRRSSPARSATSTPSGRPSAPRTPTPRGTWRSSGWSSRRWRSAT